jgi:tetratricopeptide (TPR) repeat protein
MKRIGFLWVTIFILALSGSILVGRGLEARGGTREIPDEPLYLPSATFLRYASIGYRSMVADLMWIRATQEFGKEIMSKKKGERKHKFLFPLLDLSVSLDPHFIGAYRFGGLLLHVVKQVDNAIALYEKGYAANPDRWEMPHDLGRLYFLDLKDHEKALYWWKITDTLPGRPGYVARFLPRLYLQAGQREIAIELWLELLDVTDNTVFRGIIKNELEKLGVSVDE